MPGRTVADPYGWPADPVRRTGVGVVARARRGRTVLGTAALALAMLGSGCSDDDDGGGSGGGSGDAAVAELAGLQDCITAVEAATPAARAVAASAALFESAAVVVVAPAADGPELRRGAEEATRRGVPLLLGAASGEPDPDATPVAAPGASTDPATDSPTPAGSLAPVESAAATPSAEPDATATEDAQPTTTPAGGAAQSTADCAEPTGSPEATGSPGPTGSSGPTGSPTSKATVEATESPEPSGPPDTSEPTTSPGTSTPESADADTGAAPGGAACLTAGEDDGDDEESRTPSATSTATATATPSLTGPADADPTDTATPTGDASSPDPGPSTPSGPPTAIRVLDPAVDEEITRLDPEVVLAMTPWLADDLRTAGLSDVRVALDPDELPETAPADPLEEVTVLVDSDDRAGALAAAATAGAAGARVVGAEGGDPRAGSCTVQALAGSPPEKLLAIGGFGPADRLADRLALAVTGVELPGGGQRLFPGRRLVAMYGYPGAPELGVLGAQGVEASVDRARALAEQYDDLSDVPVVPTFEIITTVAQSVPGSDGDYSAESTVDAVRPLVEAAHEAGMYAILDLQPGRTDFLTQAKRYEELLKLPYVGLALDPEWRLEPDQVHLRQIGSVDAAEINQVSAWLADLTTRYQLPQKLLVLHQFSLTMITNRAALDTSHDELALLIHMDGQGEPQGKEGTWRIVTNTIPEEIWLGWKNFYRKDTRLMSPTETLNRERVPVMISYQ